MAKKKSKRLIKLNNEIRKLFGNRPFEEAIAELSDDTLVELSLVADLSLSSLDRDSIIRALRRTWSEGKYNIRKNIVSYLSTEYRGKKNNIEHKIHDAANRDKVENILSLLEQMEHTREEEEKILDRFMDVRPAKITLKRISNTLEYIRLKERISMLEKNIEATLTPDGEMEFDHRFLFALPEHDFGKILLVSSQGLDLESMGRDRDDDELLNYLKGLKDRLIITKQNDIDRFVSELFGHPHPYLTDEQIERSLRQMPPEADLAHIPLQTSLVESVVKEINKDLTLVDLGTQYAVEEYRQTRSRSVVLPYRVRVVYDKSYLDAKIWRGDESLGIVEDLESVNDQILNHFENTINDIYHEAKELCDGIDVSDDMIWQYIHQFIDPQMLNTNSSKLTRKVTRRILYHFGEYLRPLREKKMREELLAKTIRDFKNLFPLARSMKRKIIFYAGPTNSGKTYTAMKRLRSVRTGYYLAPLRLLALEGYESLKTQGVTTSLITGEEEIIDEESTHISSTIEMLNFEVDVECCVIDEIQMIADRDRGWAWANALIGAPAHTVILTGSEDAVAAVTQLADYLDEELEIVRFERKNRLEMMTKPTSIKNIQPFTAIVAFSRKEVLSFKQRLSSDHKVSVIYGNLSPEVRREEARKFREGESDVLVATDAIAMGLNLPIRTLLFARDNKFDGLHRRELTTSEILQISGRAGRYGLHEHGYIGALDPSSLQTIAGKFHSSLPDIELPLSIMASLHHVELIGEILETEMLLDILTFFADNMEFEGPFRAANIESMLEVAAIVDEYQLDLRSRYHLATSPVSINSPYVESVFLRYIKNLEKDTPVPYYAPRDLPSHAYTNEELLNAEDRVKEVSLYLWLSFRFADKFPDTEAAIEARTRLNKFIERSLSKGDLVKRCSRCGKVLDLTYKYSICENCYRKVKQGVYRKKERSMR